MVTKLLQSVSVMPYGSVLAKILMVTKQAYCDTEDCNSSVLAKILMVTKRVTLEFVANFRSVLAKILMVTKHYIRRGQNL